MLASNHQTAPVFLLLVITMTTQVSPFLYYDRGQPRPLDPALFDGGDTEQSPASDIFSQHSSSSSSSSSPSSSSSMDRDQQRRYARQTSLMMAAATNPRIGVRSSLVGTADTCHVDPVRMRIQPPRKYAHLCAATTEISFGCRGGCSSYSRVDVRNTTNLLRSCSCCRPSGFGFRLVRMKCNGFALRTTVKFALGCHCRPCLASVQSVDIQRLRDLLQGTSLANIG